ncbi:MAG TPA: helix-turn-helix domain-containing protein [Blastocatellia bacterium]|nr:helix-turn-helix domain-containing protein [Blastocatellia bacterium]
MKRLDRYDLTALEQLCSQATDRRTRQRLKSIYLRGQGMAPTEIARILGRSPKTVRTWIKQFNLAGPEALKYKHTGGRTAKLNPEQEAALLTAIKEGRPDGRRWTLKALAEKVLAEYGVRLSQQQISARLRRHGLSRFLSKSARKQNAAGHASGPDPARRRDKDA